MGGCFNGNRGDRTASRRQRDRETDNEIKSRKCARMKMSSGAEGKEK